MKNTIYALIILCSVTVLATSSKAETRNEMKEFYSVKYNETILEMGYRMGGGCQEHRGEIQLSFDKKSKTVTVRVYDITPEPDYCEAYLANTVSINLKDEVAALAKQNGMSVSEAWAIHVELPKVTVKPFEP